MKFIAGHPALDFVNTVGGWRAETVLDDKLEDFDDLLRWAALAGIAATNKRPAFARRPAERARVLARARALRLALHRILDASIRRRTPGPVDMKVVEIELTEAQRHRKLTATRPGFAWVWDTRPALDSVLWRISQSAADLLTSPDLARVRRCAGESCGWMFLDRTRNHSRHWCDMKDCGNLAKVRRFRSRQAADRTSELS